MYVTSATRADLRLAHSNSAPNTAGGFVGANEGGANQALRARLFYSEGGFPDIRSAKNQSAAARPRRDLGSDSDL